LSLLPPTAVAVQLYSIKHRKLTLATRDSSVEKGKAAYAEPSIASSSNTKEQLVGLSE
jgi:hypothetical protein